MQTIIIYVNAHDTLGVVRDYANARGEEMPSLTRSVGVTLKLRLFQEEDTDTPYPMENLAGITAWQFVMDDDFNRQSTPPIIADNAGITLASVTDVINDTERTYTEITIPISQMNSEELAELIGSNELVDQLVGELVGFDSNADKVFICQIKGFTVRNLVYDTGTPTEVKPDYLNASQVRALIASGAELQFSEDGTDWHATQTDDDDYLRFRSASDASAAWSAAIQIPRGQAGTPGDPGTPGTDGANAYLYIRYASDDQGTDFSATPAISRKYIGVKTTDEAIETPSAADFTGLWVKFLGDDGTGTGDMLKSIYDPNEDGKVTQADSADEAVKLQTARSIGNAVFDGSADITLAAIGAAAANHTHDTADIANPAEERFYEDNSEYLYINRGITRRTNSASGALNINVAGIRNADGTPATIAQNRCYTWELHIRATAAITEITIGSNNSTMSGISIPENLPLVNSRTTYHVFTIRGFYNSEAKNNIKLHVNYAYSYEG